MPDYQAFLATKQRFIQDAGRVVSDADLHPSLFPFQRDLVRYAVRKGRVAIWSGCGSGKTRVELETIRLLGAERALIVCPLAVAQQTIAEGQKIGVEVTWCSRPVESPGIWITNYQKLQHYIGVSYDVIVLDESSVLKDYGSKTRNLLIEHFTHIPYRLCATATPAPNDLAELANHAEFLGVCKRQEMLAEFFVHDSSGSAALGGWRLKGHAQEGFWRWVATWGAYVRKPSDLAYDDGPYQLPPLEVRVEQVDATFIPEGELFPRMVKGITGRSQARRVSLTARVQRAAEIIKSTPGQWLVWCMLNAEQHALVKLLGPDCVSIEGSTLDDDKVSREIAWRSGKVRVLVSKTAIFGHGLHWCHAHQVLYLGFSDSQEVWHQSVRRLWRFGQTKPVQVVIVTSPAEQAILDNVWRKEKQAEQLAEGMVRHMQAAMLEEVRQVSSVENDYQTAEAAGKDWRVLLGDCVERVKELADQSVHLVVSSIPFGQLFVYSASPRDLGNSRSDAEFFTHLGFLAKELLRVIVPGRRVCIHVQQQITTLIKDGVIGIKDFRGDVIRLFQGAGFIYDGEVTVNKNPQVAAVRSKAKGLLFTQKNKDSSWSRPALADYVILLRAPGENPIPIQTDVTNDEWIKFAHPVWDDIRETHVLPVAAVREEQDERHLCPLSLDVIERCVRLWSNPGETCCDVFGGVGSTGVVAIQLGRKVILCELKPSYYRQSITNLRHAEAQREQGHLFSGLNGNGAVQEADDVDVQAAPAGK